MVSGKHAGQQPDVGGADDVGRRGQPTRARHARCGANGAGGPAARGSPHRLDPEPWASAIAGRDRRLAQLREEHAADQADQIDGALCGGLSTGPRSSDVVWRPPRDHRRARRRAA